MLSADKLRFELAYLELNLPDGAINQLLFYLRELERWNRKLNLTSLTGRALLRRLVTEPIWVMNQLDPAGVLLDIGSGNGSPAIPWHIASQKLCTHLVEARVRKAAFLRHVAGGLGLHNVTVHRGRLELFASGDLPQPDWITIQGVSLSDRILRSLQPLLRTTTRLVWLTTSDRKPAGYQSERSFGPPGSRTEALIFRL